MFLKNKLKKNHFIIFTYKKLMALLSKISPIIASKVKYFLSFGKRLDLNNPKTFNEKLMWIKIFEDDTIKAMCTDKYEVRNFVRDLGLEYILNELYFVYDSVDDINFDKLPNSFVLKGTHGCGCNIICSDKNTLDKEDAIRKLKKWMRTDYSLVSAEPHYSKITPRIIAEKFLGVEGGISPIDYKIHCFHGEPKLIEVVLDRAINQTKLIFLDMDWNVLPYNNNSVNLNIDIQKPEKINEMLDISRKLSGQFTYVRVDLYYYLEKIYFGELTFTPSACCHTHLFTEADYEIGELLDLNKIKQFNINL